MAGSPLKNLDLFASLCGNVGMPEVIIVTTMWTLVRPEIGSDRETELKDVFWKDMREKGCSVERFDDTQESAWKILGREAPHRAEILISEQIQGGGKSLKATAAGITLNRQLKKLKKDQREADRKLRELTTKQTDSGVLQQLRERKTRLEAKIGLVNEQLQSLKRGWFQSLFDTGGAVSALFASFSLLSHLQDVVPHVPKE